MGNESVMSPDEVLAASRRLLEHADALRDRSVGEIVAALGSAGARFLDPEDDLRARALASLPDDAGISAEMAELVLDGMARDWTEARLMETVRQDFEDPGVLDGFVQRRGRSVHAVGPELVTQIVAGSVPGVSVHALIRSLLVKSPTLLKPGFGDRVLPGLFHEALEADAEWLADAIALGAWRGSDEEATRAALRHADLVAVYGSDATVCALRALVSPPTRLVAYHHRISVVVVGRDLSDGARAEADQIVGAVGTFDQRGCVCPHLIYVEEGGENSPLEVAQAVASALDRFEEEVPAPQLDSDEGAALHQLRGVAELQVAETGGEVWHGGTTAPWTVIFEPEAREGPPTLARGVRVRPWRDVAGLRSALTPFRRHLQSVGVVGLGARKAELSIMLGRLGAARIGSPADMSFPPPWWLHDGRQPLGELVRWIELEGG